MFWLLIPTDSLCYTMCIWLHWDLLKSMQKWAQLSISQCSRYRGVFPLTEVICIGAAHFCTLFCHTLNVLISFLWLSIIPYNWTTGSMVMSPFELSVCVYFHLRCWHVVLNLLPFCPSKLLTLSDLSHCSLYHCSGFSRYSLLTEVYHYCPFCKGIFQTLVAVTLILINCCESESKGGRKKNVCLITQATLWRVQLTYWLFIIQ